MMEDSGWGERVRVERLASEKRDIKPRHQERGRGEGGGGEGKRSRNAWFSFASILINTCK